MSKPDRLPAVPDVVPPIGWVLVREQGSGNEYWVDPASIKIGERRSALSAEQIGRVKRIAQVFSEFLPGGPDAWSENFSRDSDPESEIVCWEQMADVFDKELRARPDAQAADRKLVYSVLVCCSLLTPETCTIGNVLSMCPAAKRLTNATEVVQRFAKLRFVL